MPMKKAELQLQKSQNPHKSYFLEHGQRHIKFRADFNLILCASGDDKGHGPRHVMGIMLSAHISQPEDHKQRGVYSAQPRPGHPSSPSPGAAQLGVFLRRLRNDCRE